MPEGPPGLYARVMEPLGVAGLAGDVAGAAMDAFALELPQTPRFARAPGMRAIWAGPQRWLVVAESDVEAALTDRLGPGATVTDQTDARVVFQLSGPRARDTLAKGCGLDLHPSVFAPGHVAWALVAHVACALWQEDEAPTYAVAVPRSYAGSVAAWLVASASEYGLQIEPAAILRP